MKAFKLLLFTTLIVPPTFEASWAGKHLTEAIDAQVQSDQASLAAQKAIDAITDQSRSMAEEYREALRKTEALTAYNAHLRQLVDSQEASKQSLEKQIGNIELTRREVVPLMLRMVEALDRFVSLDRPFLLEDRAHRVEELKNLMNRADVGDAEKFRRLIDAYETENNFGKTIETYRGELKTGNNIRTVDFLRVGRTALLYLTLDGKETGVWDALNKTWHTLPSDNLASVGKGLAIARKETSPQLLTIPVELTEANP